MQFYLRFPSVKALLYFGDVCLRHQYSIDYFGKHLGSGVIDTIVLLNKRILHSTLKNILSASRSRNKQADLPMKSSRYLLLSTLVILGILLFNVSDKKEKKLQHSVRIRTLWMFQ